MSEPHLVVTSYGWEQRTPAEIARMWPGHLELVESAGILADAGGFTQVNSRWELGRNGKELYGTLILDSIELRKAELEGVFVIHSSTDHKNALEISLGLQFVSNGALFLSPFSRARHSAKLNSEEFIYKGFAGLPGVIKEMNAAMFALEHVPGGMASMYSIFSSRLLPLKCFFELDSAWKELLGQRMQKAGKVSALDCLELASLIAKGLAPPSRIKSLHGITKLITSS